MNKNQYNEMQHAIKNGTPFYTEANNSDWNDLVEKGFALKRNGWEGDMAYYVVTEEGKRAMELTPYQVGKLKHAFGLDYSRTPYRNYYYCNKENAEWEDLIVKGFAEKRSEENAVVYYGTLKGLRRVFRRNVSFQYYEAI